MRLPRYVEAWYNLVSCPDPTGIGSGYEAWYKLLATVHKGWSHSQVPKHHTEHLQLSFL